MKIATFLPNMTDVQEPEQEELNENHIPPKLRALPVSAVLHLAKPRRMGKARKKIITPLRSLRKNLATLAVPYLPSSVPKSPLAPRTKGYRPQLRSSDFLLPYFLICLLYPYMPYMVKKLWGLGYGVWGLRPLSILRKKQEFQTENLTKGSSLFTTAKTLRTILQAIALITDILCFPSAVFLLK